VVTRMSWMKIVLRGSVTASAPSRLQS